MLVSIHQKGFTRWRGSVANASTVYPEDKKILFVVSVPHNVSGVLK
jgi:hypothetical protein